jgi:outer membrane protein OmpA-like peptidoglycan-associated protein/ABC-type nitrate/sulfonate/bicarbonate transport system substrate-binding protein
LLLLLGGAAIGAWALIRPHLEERGRQATSDAGSQNLSRLRIGGDGYLGYWFITSPEMRKLAARTGLTIDFTDDNGAYAERLERFSRGEYDIIVLPVNSYLLHGAKHRFPGVIVASIAESKGADGILGKANRFPKGEVSELNDSALSVVYTSESPSSFLIDLIMVDFQLSSLAATSTWRVEVAGPREVLDKARRNEGDVFVLWEPELSQASAEIPGLKYLWGSDRFGGYIVDVFVVNRDCMRSREKDIARFLDAYFQAMRLYANDRARMISDIAATAHIRKEVAESMLKKIDFLDLGENALTQFGIPTGRAGNPVEGLSNCIISCTNVLLRVGKLPKDPLEGNPYSIINSKLLQELSSRAPAALGGAATTFRFSPLDESGWKALREVGVLRVEPISFRPGDNVLDDEGKAHVDDVAALLLNNYPEYRVVVRGHTGPGNEEENLRLSLERATAVLQYLGAVHGMDPHRLHAEGYGSKSPPSRRPGESERAYRYRLPRVEFILKEGNPL